MLESIKLTLRIKSELYDEEIIDLIEAAKKDLKISGVEKIDTKDPLIKRAINMYVKANFGWDNPDAERFRKAYIVLVHHLALCGDYNAME